MSYLDLGYNQYLTKEQPSFSPSEIDPLQAQQFTPTIEGTKIDSEMDGQFVGPGINASHITAGFMEFTRGRGGMLQLGGFNNLNGTFALLDADEIERITMDKDGMVINKGAMTIKDQTNQTIVDSTGLRSTTNFVGDTIVDSNAFTTTSDTFVDVTNMSLSFNLKRGSKLLVGASVVGRNDSISDSQNYGAISQIVLDNVSILGYMVTPGIPLTAGLMNLSAATSGIVNVSAGNHTLRLQLERTGGGTARLSASNPKTLWYVILGN